MNTELGSSEDRARFFRWGSWAMLILAVFLGVQTLGSFRGLTNIDPAYNSISVTGEGEVVAIPDVATFSFSVSADASDVNIAQSRVEEKMDAVLAALKDLGIEDKDIKTSDYSVWPKYRYETAASYPCTPYSCPPSPGGRQIPDGYTANHNVMVKVRNTAEAGKVLGVVGEKGATNISGISFTTDDLDGLYDEARALAIADAKDKAKALAKDLGVRLVRVVSYNDNMGYPYPAQYDREMGMGGDSVSSVKVAPSIPTGENKIIINVMVTYEIR